MFYYAGGCQNCLFSNGFQWFSVILSYTCCCSPKPFTALPVRFRALDLDQLSVLDLTPTVPANKKLRRGPKAPDVCSHPVSRRFTVLLDGLLLS